MDLGYYNELFRSALGGRKWILSDIAIAATRSVEWLRELGAPDPFVIAGTTGTGELPDLPDENIALLGTKGTSMMEAIRSFYDATHRPLPPDAQRKLDAWDPESDARVFATFLDADRPVGGRPQFGARPPRWLSLEDKTVVDALWDEVGITRAATRVIELEPAPIAAALTELDIGAEIVLTGDNRQGWHGGAEYIRVVRTPSDISKAVDFLSPRCHRARVMPYLEGIPCSIHGLVFPDYVLTVRPVEMIVLYQPDQMRFRYASVSGYWDSSAEEADYMRDLAVRVGAHLRTTIGYRGGLTIDGVMTRDGFLPTELNPRTRGRTRRSDTTRPECLRDPHPPRGRSRR
jgi:hypothetical protein